MQFCAYLSVSGLSDIGLAFYNSAGTIIGARTTAGMIDTGAGYYEVNATPPTGAVTWRINSLGTAGAEARGTIDPAAPSAADMASAAWNALTNDLTTAGSIGQRLVAFVGSLTYAVPPTDYQQRGQAVTLPTLAPAGYGGTDSTVALAALQTTANTIKTKTDPLGTANVVVQSPVTAEGKLLQLERGDDYLSADGRQIDFTFINCPNLLGSNVSLKIGSAQFPGTVRTATSARWELTSVQTRALSQLGPYAIRATLADGHAVTLVTGTCRVNASN